jgi:hypothetical protein
MPGAHDKVTKEPSGNEVMGFMPFLRSNPK